MKIAIPVQNGILCNHFGHCETFAILEVDTSQEQILTRRDVPAPPHQPGFLPPWLKEKGVDLVIAGGMGQRALSMFKEQGVDVLVGAPGLTPEELVFRYLKGTLVLGQNVCDH